MISTSLTMDEGSIDILDNNFSQDVYRDWSREVDENLSIRMDNEVSSYSTLNVDKINAKEYAINKIINRGR